MNYIQVSTQITKFWKVKMGMLCVQDKIKIKMENFPMLNMDV